MEGEERVEISEKARLVGRGCGGGSRIRRLQPEDASVLRSEVVIGDVGDIVYELVANAIDAAATEVRCSASRANAGVAAAWVLVFSLFESRGLAVC